MLPLRNVHVSNSHRKSNKDDWICMRCSNYNYSFRNLCNRCQTLTRSENTTMMDAMGKENYGENSFPSVLFLTPSEKGVPNDSIRTQRQMQAENAPQQENLVKSSKDFRSSKKVPFQSKENRLEVEVLNENEENSTQSQKWIDILLQE